MPYSRHHFQGMKWRREGRGEENRKGEREWWGIGGTEKEKGGEAEKEMNRRVTGGRVKMKRMEWVT